MTANRLLLLLNSLLLLLILGQRTQSEGGHLGWLQALPWNSFGTELADLSSQAQVSAGAVISLWLVLSAGWLLITFIVERQHRRAMAAAEVDTNSRPVPDPPLASQAHAHASHGQAVNALRDDGGAALCRAQSAHTGRISSPRIQRGCGSACCSSCSAERRCEPHGRRCLHSAGALSAATERARPLARGAR
ncbi:MAG: hypothetical protein ACO311_06920 [Burkholderiaceae bacterium]